MKKPLSERTLARCGIGACPAVYDNEDGTFDIVGAIVTPDAELAEHVSDGEQVVRIDAALVYQAVAEKLFRAGPAGLSSGDGALLFVFVRDTLRSRV